MLAAFLTLAETILAQESSPAWPGWPLARSPRPPRIRRSAWRRAPGGPLTWPPAPVPPRRRCPRSRSGPVVPKQGVGDWPACAVWDDVSCHMRESADCECHGGFIHSRAAEVADRRLQTHRCSSMGTRRFATDPKQPGQPATQGLCVAQSAPRRVRASNGKRYQQSNVRQRPPGRWLGRPRPATHESAWQAAGHIGQGVFK